jgi:hypothetical protein
MVTDQQLLDFDWSGFASIDAERAHESVEGEDGDLYRNHLLIARWLDMWREGMERQAGRPAGSDPERQSGISYALTEVAAHLRQGDFLPGGKLHEQEQRRTD